MRSFEEKIRALQRQHLHNQLLDLDLRSFSLDLSIGRLERQWPGSTPAEQSRLRIQRMEVRAELEILKIEIDSIERQAIKLGFYSASA